MTIAKFNIPGGSLENFYRTIRIDGNVSTRGDDCMISAVQILGLIEPREAELMRIILRDGGILTKHIGDFFTILIPEYIWRYQVYHNKRQFYNRVNELEPGQVIFCGYFGDDKLGIPGHVFLIGRSDEDGRLYSLDPQVQSAPSLIEERNKYTEFLDGREYFYILHTIGRYENKSRRDLTDIDDIDVGIGNMHLFE